MKKKILFVIPSLKSGGAEKSLITLLSLFDYEKYEVDLLSFRREGLFFDKIPAEVNVIKGTEDYEAFDGDAKKAIKYFIKKGKLSSVIDRIKYIKSFNEADSSLREKKKWDLLKKQLPHLNRKYDCAVGYLEGNASYFVADNVVADKKICYVHNDFKKLGLDVNRNRNLFKKCDKVVTVSQVCLDSLIDEFPDFQEKFIVVENITSPKIIKIYSLENTPYKKDENTVILNTVGRLAPQKAIDLAVKTCAELKRRGKNIKWYHIGTGELKEEIETLMRELGVETDFILLGERSNPYPYIAGCDIYVQPSRYEGKSIAIDEAKCLLKPIVTTNFTTVKDQITDGVNGLVCEMNEKDIADKLERLIDNADLRQKLSENLAKENLGNEEELEKFYGLIN
ncbi:MAG: glycosyltransferase [Clostridia bacterium]|nr:glycosyltransferase [Clostridia bacterium]